MIFAELEYQASYTDVHPELAAFLSTHFSLLESGLQGDSWIWIFDGDGKVEVDTFSSMRHQIKSAKPGPHVQKVIEVLMLEYRVNVYPEPELEPHEDV